MWNHSPPMVSSSMIDRVAARLERPLVEVPVGFKWFVQGLLDGDLGFGGEESAGASFLRRDGSPWSTDKDGILLDLLASEILAVTGRTPSEHYRDLTARFGEPAYARIDAPADREEKAVLGRLSPEQITARELAGEPITAVLTSAPGNGAAIGGLKVTTESGWFAARPSGTEDVYKIYAESFQGPEHLARIQEAFCAMLVGIYHPRIVYPERPAAPSLEPTAVVVAPANGAHGNGAATPAPGALTETGVEHEQPAPRA